MKKTILTLLVFSLAASYAISQSVDDGIKFIYYQRYKSAREALEKVVASNPKDGRSIYWLGQAYLGADDVAGAKALYQKALNDGVNDAWIWIGSGHVQILENNDVNSAKQKFEQAITATKGKKGAENPDILNAIGRAMADGNSQQGDPQYGIDKLTRAAQLNPKDPSIEVNLGVCYLKQGSEKGGPAVEAFTEATRRNPQYAEAYWRIGRIYQSQSNVEFMNEWFGKAIAADPAFAPVYLDYFKYYAERDVNVAKEYLDKYVASADKDCSTDYFVADYLYRAGKYQESIAKAKEMENGQCKDYIRVNILYAYDYTKLGDSVTALNAIKKFFANAPEGKIDPHDYVIAATVYSKFPGNADSVASYTEKAIALDTVTENRIEYIKTVADLMAKDSMFDKQYQWLARMAALKGKPSATDFFYMAKAAVDSKNCTLADSVSKAYIAAYPDVPQGYSFAVTAAKTCDVDTTKGLAVEPINTYITFLMKDTTKNKKTIFNNYYYLLIYYAQYAKELPKAIETIDKMMVLYPDPASEENQFCVKTKDQLQKAQQKKSGTGNANSNKSSGGK